MFQHGMSYGKYKDLAKRTELDKVLRDKAFKIASNSKYDGYQKGLVSMVFRIFDKISTDSGVRPMSSQQLADELHNQLLENFNKEEFIPRLKTMFGVAI